MGQPVRYTIRFEGLDAVGAGRAAESLRRSLQEEKPEIIATRVRTDADLMDFGTALSVVLTAPAIIELAKGLSNWLARTHSSRVTVTGPDGVTIVENISSREAVSLAEKLQARHADR